jgi:S1-C subfamily serine protease
VGINTALVGAEGNIGLGLAIPINMAQEVYEQLQGRSRPPARPPRRLGQARSDLLAAEAAEAQA